MRHASPAQPTLALGAAVGQVVAVGRHSPASCGAWDLLEWGTLLGAPSPGGEGPAPLSPQNPSSHRDAPSSQSEPVRAFPTDGGSWMLLGCILLHRTFPEEYFFPLPKDCSSGARLCKHCKVSSDSSRHSGALSAGE